jgi:acylphosphatase
VVSGETEVAVKVRIRGRVQGVYYRGWAVEEARARGLRGWVRNRSEGSVEALFAGPAAAVEEMIEACRKGPPSAEVFSLERKDSDDDGVTGFHQLPTK